VGSASTVPPQPQALVGRRRPCLPLGAGGRDRGVGVQAAMTASAAPVPAAAGAGTEAEMGANLPRQPCGALPQRDNRTLFEFL